VPTSAERGCHVVSVTDPHGRILDFLDRESTVKVKKKRKENIGQTGISERRKNKIKEDRKKEKSIKENSKMREGQSKRSRIIKEKM
jgi:hypothetical protein